jgi:hypothetical protein
MAEISCDRVIYYYYYYYYCQQRNCEITGKDRELQGLRFPTFIKISIFGGLRKICASAFGWSQ